jgi:hypothetical protein
MFGAVQGVRLAVGPQALKVTVPVGDPFFALPVIVTVSVSLLPTETLGLLSADFMVGVAGCPFAALTPAVAATTRATSRGTVISFAE